jgi:hypothetical protein
VKEWRKDHGQKKQALAATAAYFQRELDSGRIAAQYLGARDRRDRLSGQRRFSNALNDFTKLHLGASEYIGDMKGLKVIKDDIADNNISYLEAGDVMTVDQLEGVRFFVLGPPTSEQWDDVKTEKGAEGETYEHNKDLDVTGAFTAAALSLGDRGGKDAVHAPFGAEHLVPEGAKNTHDVQQRYQDEAWRRIDYDWLQGAGSLALRLNSHTNNLSVVLAIELEENGKVMLFTGDAEFGSWQSWHKIVWNMTGADDDKHLTEDLLNRTVLYKVAHHLSHNGTARSNGLEMMTDGDLAAMASLDYDQISSGWTSTMPNRAIVKELLKRTKGRLMIMNEDKLFLNKSKTEPIDDKIEEARGKMSPGERAQFNNDFDDKQRYLQYRIRL